MNSSGLGCLKEGSRRLRPAKGDEALNRNWERVIFKEGREAGEADAMAWIA